MPKTRIVCDTNVLISALGWQGAEHDLVRKALVGDYKLFFSTDILEEFNGVATRQRFDFSAEEIDLFTEALIAGGTLVFPVGDFDIIKEDPADNKVLACAFEAKADYLATGDAHLLKLKEFRGTRIVTTREFFDSIHER